MPNFAPSFREIIRTLGMAVYIMNKVKTSILFLLLCSAGVASAQTEDERLSVLEEKLQSMSSKQKYLPQIHGILRGKYEYQPELGASRFEVRNARLSAEGALPLRSSYKLEVDLCDESAIKMKDAWVRVNPVSTLRITLGQQRMPFSIDAHRNPSAQYFANRSFIAKQVGDMRDVGLQLGYSPLLTSPRGGKTEMHFDVGIFNGSNLDNQKTAWFKSISYSARAQFIYTSPRGSRPTHNGGNEGGYKVALIPSVQHQFIAGREASYTSMDFGAYYEWNGLHLEAEYLRKFYAKNVFDDCNAVNTMAIYKQKLKKEKSFIQSISYLLRYDYMDNHSDGKKGMEELPANEEGQVVKRLIQSDAQRHRLTAGFTFSLRNPYFPTDIRLNYEKYWYPNNGTPKESERDKLVAELMIKF